MGVRAGEVSKLASEAVTSAMRGAILTAAVVAVVTNAKNLIKTPKMVPSTALGGSGRTRTGMAAVGLRLGAEMAPTVTGMLVSPLRESLPVNQHPSLFPSFRRLCILEPFCAV